MRSPRPKLRVAANVAVVVVLSSLIIPSVARAAADTAPATATTATADPKAGDNVTSKFALHDRDTVVFLGDSITAEGTYAKVIEQYMLLRFPERKIHFINAGIGGDTAAGGLKRLDRDVFSRGATV